MPEIAIKERQSTEFENGLIKKVLLPFLQWLSLAPVSLNTSTRLSTHREKRQIQGKKKADQTSETSVWWRSDLVLMRLLIHATKEWKQKSVQSLLYPWKQTNTGSGNRSIEHRLGIGSRETNLLFPEMLKSWFSWTHQVVEERIWAGMLTWSTCCNRSREDGPAASCNISSQVLGAPTAARIILRGHIYSNFYIRRWVSRKEKFHLFLN